MGKDLGLKLQMRVLNNVQLIFYRFYSFCQFLLENSLYWEDLELAQSDQTLYFVWDWSEIDPTLRAKKWLEIQASTK